MGLPTIAAWGYRLGGQVFTIALVVALLCTRTRAEDLEATLEMPLSPGSVALLAVHPAHPAIRERLAAGLKDPRAEVRAASARVATVSGAVAFADSLQEALLAEQDPRVAAELVLALAVLGGPAFDEQLLTAAERLGAGVPKAVADALARTRGKGALAYLARLLEADRSSVDPAFVAVATNDGVEDLSLVGAKALERGDETLWNTVLRMARRPGSALDSSEIVAALESRNEAIQASTYLHLALVLAARRTLEPVVRTAVDDALKEPPPNDLAAAFSRELLGRLLGRKPTEQVAWMASLGQRERGSPYAYELGEYPSLRRHLTSKEAASLESRLSGGGPNGHEKPAGRSKDALIGDDRPVVASGLHTVDGFPAGFVGSVLAVTGCKASAAEGVAAADISYRMDGRPRTITLIRPDGKPLGNPPACQRAADVLLVTGLARRGQLVKPDVKEAVLVVLSPSALSCLAENEAPRPGKGADQSGGRSHRVGGQIQEPKKLKNVPPRYPPAAIQARIQGIVSVEAVISASGCVRGLAILRGIPALDWAALSAVAEWRYTPTLLDGVPVPVVMTVTVNFRLN